MFINSPLRFFGNFPGIPDKIWRFAKTGRSLSNPGGGERGRLPSAASGAGIDSHLFL
jgi:hypothetical protein